MKQRSHDQKSSQPQSVANELGKSGGQSSSQSYQIDDRRSASVMQRKFRNLANGLASANIIQPKSKPLQLKSKPPCIPSEHMGPISLNS